MEKSFDGLTEREREQIRMSGQKAMDEYLKALKALNEYRLWIIDPLWKTRQN